VDIAQNLTERLNPGEALVLVTETDLRKDGTFGRRWFAVTDRRLLTFADGPEGDGWEVEVALADVKELRTVHHVGRMGLEAQKADSRVEVLSCTNGLATRFAKIAHAVTKHCKEEWPLEISLEDEERRVCEHCGRPLPEAGSFCPVCLKKGKVLARLWTYMRPHRRKLLVVSSLVLSGAVVNLAPPYLVKTLVDDVLLGDSGRRLLLLVLALAGSYLAGTLIGIVRGRMSARLASRMMHEVRFDFYQAVQGLSLRRYDKTQTGTLISRLTGDTQMLNFVFADVGAFILPALVQIVGICVVLFFLDWRLALWVLIPAPLLVLVTLLTFRRLRRSYHRLWQRRAKMTARANDAISGIRVIKAFSQEPKEIDRFSVRSGDVADATAFAEGMFSTVFPTLNFLTMFGTFFVWYFGGIAVMEHRVSLGALMAFVAYLTMFYGPLQMLTRFGDFLNRAFTAAQRLFEVTDADQEIYDDPDAQPLASMDGAFEFEGVHFGYVKDRPVLKGVDAKVEAGEMVGLVGRSGVGKTTMTNLICRFYDVDEGAIKVDGVDVRKVRLRDLRRHIGIVPQESYLFDGTVADNIGFAKPDATRADVMRVAKAANAHGFIMRLPGGYDTRVGEKGARLSGGEKQRIAIARAILHDPKILILDEATSSVDTETEELIQRALASLVEGRTTFAIAHRLSTLRHAQRLLVVDDGKVAEFGTHDELIEKKGIYSKLVEIQSQLSAIKAVDG